MPSRTRFVLESEQWPRPRLTVSQTSTPTGSHKGHLSRSTNPNHLSPDTEQKPRHRLHLSSRVSTLHYSRNLNRTTIPTHFVLAHPRDKSPTANQLPNP